MAWASLYPSDMDGAMRRLATTLRWASCTIFARASSDSPARTNERSAICGLLLAEGGGREISERLGLHVHLQPSLIIVVNIEFPLEFVEGEEQEFADEGQVGGGSGRDAVLGDGFIEFAEGEVDVRGSHEAASESDSEFGAEVIGFGNLALGASVENA